MWLFKKKTKIETSPNSDLEELRTKWLRLDAKVESLTLRHEELIHLLTEISPATGKKKLSPIGKDVNRFMFGGGGYQTNGAIPPLPAPKDKPPS